MARNTWKYLCMKKETPPPSKKTHRYQSSKSRELSQHRHSPGSVLRPSGLCRRHRIFFATDAIFSGAWQRSEGAALPKDRKGFVFFFPLSPVSSWKRTSAANDDQRAESRISEEIASQRSVVASAQ